MPEATSPADETKQLPLSHQLDEIGTQHGISRDGTEDDAAYADRIIDAIDTKVQDLWNTQDVICTLMIGSVSES